MKKLFLSLVLAVMLAGNAFAAIVSKDFTALGFGPALSVKVGDSFTYAVSGTFSGTVVLQTSSTGGATWETVASATAAASGTVLAESRGSNQVMYRFACTAFTSGTIVTTMTDATGYAVPVQEFKNKNGKTVAYTTETGLVVEDLTVTGSNSGAGVFSKDAWVDPVATAGSNGSIAAGIVSTTTGTITISTPTLVVADAAGWTVGMGIAVANAGTGGNTELITYITAISGNTFTLATNAIATATAQTVYHDDTRALTSAIQSGKNVHLRAGNYNVTSVLNITNALIIQGDGNRGRNIANGETLTTMGTAIVNRGTTNNVITNTTVGDTKIMHLAILQDLNKTASAGYAIIFGDNTVKMLNTGISYVTIYGTWGGIKIGGLVSIGFYDHIWVTNKASGSTVSNAIYIDNPSPAGDLNWDKIYVQNAAATPGIGFHIVNADTQNFSNIKVNVSDPDLLIDDKSGAGAVLNLRFTNCSFESNLSSTGPMVKLTATNAAGVKNVTFVGGEFGVNATTQYGMMIDTNVKGVTVTGNLFSQLGGGINVASTQGYHTITGNIFNTITATGILLNTGANNTIATGNTCIATGACVKDLSGTTTNIYSPNMDGINSGNIGLGTWLPKAKISIVGGGIGLGSSVSSSTILNSPPSGGMIIEGNVGIGSITPGANIDVNGSIRSITGGAVGVGACWCTTPPKVLGNCTGALGTCSACNYNGSGC